jgi:hypothetical protein
MDDTRPEFSGSVITRISKIAALTMAICLGSTLVAAAALIFQTVGLNQSLFPSVVLAAVVFCLCVLMFMRAPAWLEAKRATNAQPPSEQRRCSTEFGAGRSFDTRAMCAEVRKPKTTVLRGVRVRCVVYEE